MKKNIFKHVIALASLVLLIVACSHHGTQEFEIIDVDSSNDVSMESFSSAPSVIVQEEVHAAGISVGVVEVVPSHAEFIVTHEDFMDDMDDDVAIEEGEFFEVTPL